MDLIPVLLDVGPGLVAGGTLLEQDGEDAPTILIANLAGGGIVECALDQSGVEEVREGAQRIGLETGVTGVLAGGEDLLVQNRVAVGGGEYDGGIDQRGIEVLVSLAEAALGDLAGLAE